MEDGSGTGEWGAVGSLCAAVPVDPGNQLAEQHWVKLLRAEKTLPALPLAWQQVHLSLGYKPPRRLKQYMQVAQKQESEEHTSPFPLQEFHSSLGEG